MGSRKPARLAPRLLSLLATSLLATTGFASDWYVDAVNGSNANDGTSPATAWRTISYAVTNQGFDPAGVVPFKIFLSADTVFSMDGDRAPLQELARLAKQIAGAGNVFLDELIKRFVKGEAVLQLRNIVIAFGRIAESGLLTGLVVHGIP